MELRILGPLQLVDDDGADVTPRGAQQRRALTALAAVGDDGIGVDALVELLWPAGAPSRNALQALMSKLRKVVAPATIESDGRRYRLLGATRDVDRFDRLVGAGEVAAAERLVRGRPMADLDGEAWGEAERVRIEASLRRVAVVRLDRLAVDDPDAAVAELEARVVDDPVDERWWALLMTAHVGAGRHADALRAFGRARTALATELGLEPGPELRALEARVLRHDRHDASPSAGAGPTADRVDGPARPERGRQPVPARLSSVVGRDEIVSELAALAERERLVTIVGPGGAGKTTTAQALALRWSSGDRAAWCELAPVADRDGVVRQALRALGLHESEPGVLGSAAASGSAERGAPDGAPRDHDAARADGVDGVDRIVDALATSPTTLLLDNCEHVVDVVADVAHRVLAGAPDARIVATSREPLGVPGEHVVALPSLAADEAVRLFVDRAVGHGAAPGDVDVDLAATLCERLDRLPLAIELAAARTPSMTVREIVDRLDDRFRLLAGGARTSDPRQQTLRSVIDWSHDLLDPVEQRVLRHLSVAVGGTDVGGVTRIVGPVDGSTADELAVGDALARLVSKSLVVAAPSAHGMRFDLLDTMRDYARHRLDERGETAAARARHARHVADLVRPARRALTTPAQADWIARLAAERANIDAAVAYAVEVGDGALGLSIASPLGWYLYMVGEVATGAELFDDVLALPGAADPVERAHALSSQAWLIASGPDLEVAWATAEAAVELLAEVDDPWVRAVVRNHHAIVSLFTGRLDVMAGLVEAALAAAADVDDPWIWGISRLVQGEMLEFTGAMRPAERAFAEAADWFERCGDRFAFVITSIERSEIAEQFGEYDRAVDALERGLVLADEVGFAGHALAMRARLGNLEVLRGDLDAAERHHRSLMDDARAVRMPWLVCMAHAGLSTIARRRGDLDLAGAELGVAWADRRARKVPFTRTFLLVNRGYLADQLGDGEAALRLQVEALDVARRMGAPLGVAYGVEGCAGALALHDDPAAPPLGARLLGHADAIRRRHATAMPAAERFDVDRAEERLRCRTEGAFDREFAVGAELELDTLRSSLQRFTPEG